MKAIMGFNPLLIGAWSATRDERGNSNIRARFQSPSHRGLVCDFRPLRKASASATVSIPFSSGLGLRRCIYQTRMGRRRSFNPLLIGAWSATGAVYNVRSFGAKFQSPSHRGLVCDTTAPTLYCCPLHVSIPFSSGLGLRPRWAPTALGTSSSFNPLLIGAWSATTGGYRERRPS